MEKSFYVRTQVDRLPDVGEGDEKWVQIGLRVSAVISVDEDTPIDPDQTEMLADDLKPWAWRKLDDAQQPDDPATWDPHGESAWRVFRVNADDDVVEITDKIIGGVTVDPIGPANLPTEYLTTLEADIAEMRAEPGSYALHKTALGSGRDAVETVDRTIFGLVESLSGLPHPIPAATRVFTAVSIPANEIVDLSDDTVFLAFPRMSPNSGGAPKIDDTVTWNGEPTVRARVAIDNETPNGGVAPLWDKLNFDSRASEKMTILQNESPKAMLEAASLGVRFDPPTQEQATDDDWIAHLPVRLAEAVDPALRVQTSLDAVLSDFATTINWVEIQEKEAAIPGNDKRTIAEIQQEAITRFHEALDVLAADVVLPRTVSTIAQNHELLTILNNLAVDAKLPRPEDRREAALLLLHHLATEIHPPRPGPNANWSFVRRSRIEQGLGLGQDGGGSANRAVGERHALESAEGFQAFLLDHWFGAGPTGDQSGDLSGILLEYHATRKPNAMLLNELRTTIGYKRRGVVASRMLLRRDEESGLPFRATLSDANPEATVQLRNLTRRVDIDLHTLKITRGSTQTTVDLDGVTETIPVPLDEADIVIYTAEENGGKLAVDVTSGRNFASVVAASATLLPSELAIKLSDQAGLLAPSGRLRPIAEKTLSPTRLREATALSFVAPFIPGLLRGQSDWTQPLISTSPTGGFRDRVTASVTALVKLILQTWRDEVAPTGAPPDPIRDDILRKIIDALIENGVRDAGVQIQSAIPGLGSDFASVSNAALPLSVQFDQMLDFGDDDLWQRLAGFGCFIGRSRPGAQPELLFSLNAAEAAARGENMDPIAVDPAPILPGEIAGVGQTVLRYNNRWPATRGEEDIVLEGDAPLHRRPEQLLPPRDANKPALSYGYDMHVLPYVIGQGAALPVWLRADPKKPLLRRGAPMGAPRNALAFAGLDAPVVRMRYQRSRAVGIPLIAPIRKGQPALGTIPNGLDPLAKELPIRPAPVTLQPDAPACFFCGAQPGRGVLSPDVLPQGASGVANGFRIDFGGVPKDGEFILEIHGKEHGDPTALPKLRLALQIKAQKSLLRIDLLQVIDPDKKTVLTAAAYHADPPNWAEDVPEYEAFGVTPDPIEGQFHELFLVLRGDGVTLEAPVARPVALPPAPVSVPQDGAAPASTAGETTRHANQVSSTTFDPLEQVGETLIAPEATHSARQILLINGMQSEDTRSFRVRRPSVDFATFERWINSGFLDDRATGAGFKAILNNAFDLSVFEPPAATKQTDDATRNPSKDYDDPAVTGTLIELVQVFPKFDPNPVGRMFKAVPDTLIFRGFQQPNGALFHRPDPGLFFTCNVKSGTDGDLQTARIESTDDEVTVIVPPGHCYELRFSAAIPLTQGDASSVPSIERLAEAVRAGLRLVPGAGPGSVDVWVGGAQVITIEAAKMHEIDAFDAEWDKDTAIAELRRPPKFGTEVVRIRLPERLVSESAYPEMRLIRDVTLETQRWSWRGRPQPDIRPFDLFHGQAPGLRSANVVADAAFSDRRTEDIGPTETRKLDRQHVYDGRQRQGQNRLPTIADRPVLFEKQLDWQAGMHLRRFGLRLQSRYALLPHEGASITRTHVSGSKTPRWSTVVIPDRVSNREIGRPGVALVLPLTEPRVSRDPTPPLLVMLNERLYDKMNFADGVEAVVEMARHPYTQAEQQDIEDPGGAATTPLERLKYWQELGPDPIRTHEGNEGRIIPLRMDGPIGYGTDQGTETGSFASASFLLNPAGERIAPWTLAKLRLRRLESPEAMFTPEPNGFPPKVTRPEIQLEDGTGIVVQVRNPGAGLNNAAAIGEVFDAFRYEGLVVDVSLASQSDGATATGEFSFSLMEADVDPAPVAIRYRIDKTRLTISANTRLGPAGEIAFNIADTTDVRLRLIVSEREKPSADPNSKRQDAKWTPAGDVSVRLFIEDNPELSQSHNLERNGWLSVLTMPLLSDVGKEVSIDEPGNARIKHDGVEFEPVVRPARLSHFTPGLWCQFGESMSVFSARYLGAESEAPLLVSTAEPNDLKAAVQVEDEVARISISSPRLEEPYADLDDGDVPGPLVLEAVAKIDETAQLEERLFAVVTYFTRDVFDRAQERPFAIVPIVDPDTENAPIGRIDLRVSIGSRDGSYPALPGEARMPFGPGVHGRLRLLKILVPKERARGGYAKASIEDVLHLMTPPARNGDGMNPTDADGIFLGISHPLEFSADF